MQHSTSSNKFNRHPSNSRMEIETQQKKKLMNIHSRKKPKMKTKRKKQSMSSTGRNAQSAIIVVEEKGRCKKQT